MTTRQLNTFCAILFAALFAAIIVACLCAEALSDSPRSGKWPAVERAHLVKQPECQACGSREQLTVHHIRPFHLYPDLELDPDNLITLCQKHHCHFFFGHACDYKAWNPNVVADAKRARKMIENRLYEREKP